MKFLVTISTRSRALNMKRYILNPFQADFPLMEKPSSWFLLAKKVKNNCESVILIKNAV